MNDTLGELISALQLGESLLSRSSELRNKMKGAAIRGTQDCAYALAAAQCMNDADRFFRGAMALPGVDAIRAQCEAEWGEFVAIRVRQVRGRLCLDHGLSTEDANSLSLSHVADL